MQLKIKVNDEVVVRTGKDLGKKGKVEKIYINEGKVLVSGVNVYKKHIKKSFTGRQGSIIEAPRPLLISKLALVCPNCHKNVRVGFKVTEKKKTRICKNCKKEI
ncbi:MAG TPA: 50S ribosomal protein L24 [Patescibacteria group bacterium]